MAQWRKNELSVKLFNSYLQSVFLVIFCFTLFNIVPPLHNVPPFFCWIEQNLFGVCLLPATLSLTSSCWFSGRLIVSFVFSQYHGGIGHRPPHRIRRTKPLQRCCSWQQCLLPLRFALVVGFGPTVPYVRFQQRRIQI